MRLTAILVLSLSALVQGQGVAADDPATLVPNDVDLYLEIASPAGLFERLQASEAWGHAGRAGLPDKVRADAGLTRVIDGLKILEPLLRGRIVIAARDESTGPRVMALIENTRGLDLDAVQSLIVSLPFPEPLEVKTDQNGQVRELSAAGILTTRGEWIVWATTSALASRVRGLRESASLARLPAFATARAKAAGAAAFAWGHPQPWLQRSDDWGKPADDFLQVLLFSGLGVDLAHSDHASATLALDPDLRLEVAFTRPLELVPAWGVANVDAPIRPLPTSTIGVIRLQRDFAAFWKRRLDFVPESALPNLAEFSQGMNTLMAGMPFDEVAELIEPGIEVIVADLPTTDVEAARLPEPLLPAFALCLDVRFDAARRTRFTAAFQTALGLINADAGQKGRPPFLQYSERHGTVDIHAARPVLDADDTRRGIELNFSPAMAFVGDRLILSTSVRLVRELVACRTAGAAGHSSPATGDVVRVAGARLAEILRANLAYFTDIQVLEGAPDAARTSAELAALFDLAASIAGVEVSHVDTQEHSTWSLRVGRVP